MKRKFRIITVNQKQFAWWYSFCHGTELHLSPIQDKTAVITVRFPSEKSDDFFTVFPLFISMSRENQSCRIKIIEPKMTALFLQYLQNRFQTRTSVSLDGSDLLRRMGWHIIRIENGFDW